MSLNFDLLINRGESWQCIIPVLDSNGDPVSLAGWTARSQIRASPSSSTVLHSWTIGNGLTVDTNSIVLTVSPTVSSTWTWLLGYYDVELVDLNGNVTRLIKGRVLSTPEITR